MPLRNEQAGWIAKTYTRLMIFFFTSNDINFQNIIAVLKLIKNF